MEPNANTNVSRHNSGPASPVGKRSRHAALTGHVGFAASAAAPSQQVRDVTTQQWCTPLAGRGGVRVRRCDRRQNILTGAASIFFQLTLFALLLLSAPERGILRSPTPTCTRNGNTVIYDIRSYGHH